MIDARKILIGYAGITTLALSWFLVTAASPATTKFGEIDVQRINVREPDGTLRMTISNAATAPGIIVRGKQYPHPSRASAGMLFYNEEGSENGGLIFDGKMKGGKPQSGGSLTFDQYEQDQVVQMIGEQDGERKRAGIAISDRPDAPMDFAAITRASTLPAEQRMAAYRAANIAQTSRLFVGRDVDGSSQLALRDGMGRTRLVLRVTENGAATIDFLDPAGQVTRTVRGTSQ